MIVMDVLAVCMGPVRIRLDASSIKRLVERKSQLAQKPEFAGKITNSIKERLWSGIYLLILFFILFFTMLQWILFSLCTLFSSIRHAGKHVGESINKLALEAMKILLKSRPVAPTSPKKGSTKFKMEAYQLARVELKVLESNKSYNYN
jgi:hypothetical protein